MLYFGALGDRYGRKEEEQRLLALYHAVDTGAKPGLQATTEGFER